jgi:murein L,D-transpeptidase YcbB/YkuD
VQNRCLPLLLLLVALASSTCRAPSPEGAPKPSATPAETAASLRRVLDARCHPGASSVAVARCEEARRLYGDAPQLLWWAQDGPTLQARALAAAFANAARRGLDPAHYATAAQAVEGSVPEAASGVRAERDVALSLAALRFVSDLGVGRVPPHAAGFALVPEAEVHDPAAEVAALARAADVDAALARLDPPFAGYRLLEAALERYRRLAGDPDLALSLPEDVRPGAAFPQATGLRRLLTALGDLPAGTPPASAAPEAPAVYDAALAAGVVRFQRRHGLAEDGRLGPRTRAALAVPLAQRVEQIELSLERFRWLPHRFPAPPLAVNIPEFRLFALRATDGGYERASGGLDMKVIVGEAWEKQTPVFSAEIRTVVFWPFWEVPASIAQGEMLPALRRDPAYLTRQQLEIVEGSAPVGTELPPSEEILARLAAGGVRLRQRPGPHNSLGLVKFLLPNPYSVYLHGTPARGLFARDRRDFSHGCIRVEDPLALALHVLREQPGWDLARIQAALAGPRTESVPLAHPVPVYVLYVTAVPRDGEVHFFPDVYGLDAKLRELLAAISSDA